MLDLEDRIREAISKKGAKSVKEVANIIGVSRSTVYNYRNTVKLPLCKRGRPIIFLNRENVIRDALSQGVNSLEELCKRGRFENVVTFWQYCKEENISLPDNLIPYRQNVAIDELIDEGLSLDEMGRRFNRTREWARRYVVASGQHKLWKEKRKLSYKKDKKQLLKKVLSLTRERAKQLAKNEEFAVQKSVEYLFSLKSGGDRNLRMTKNTYQFSRLCQLFDEYEQALKRGEKLSLEELGKKADISTMQVQRIFKIASVEPMYSRSVKTISRGEKDSAVTRGIKTCFSNTDIAYFLGLPEYISTMRFTAKGISRESSGFNVRLGRGKKVLTYRLASQIYEAVDAKFKYSEILELFNIHEEILDYSLTNMDEIKDEIINGLKILCNDKNVSKPYVTKRIRERLEKEG